MPGEQPSQPMPLERLRRAGWTAWAVIGILVLLAIVYDYVLQPLSVLVFPVALALVVVYILNPVVSILERRGIRRWLAVLTIYAIFLILMGSLLAVIVPMLGEQIGALVEKLPEWSEKVTRELNQFAAARGWDLKIESPAGENGVVETVQANRDTIVSVLGGVGQVAGAVLHFVVAVIIGIILSVYLLLDLPKIQRNVKRAIPQRHRAEVLTVLDKVGGAIGGFFRGQFLVALFVGVASALGLALVKLPFAALIGLLAGIFNLVPLIGPFLAGVPAVIVGLLSGDPKRALWAALVLLVVQQVDNHIVSPNIMGRTVRLHPITVMLALLAGGTTAGIPGMLVIIPLIAAVKVVVLHFWERGDIQEVAADVAAEVSAT